VIRHRPARTPTVTIPAADLERLQKRVASLEVNWARERAELIEVHKNFHACSRSNSAFCENLAVHRAGLRDLMAFYDRASAGRTEWTWSDVKRLEEIRGMVKP
jgi:hypothetical protein